MVPVGVETNRDSAILPPIMSTVVVRNLQKTFYVKHKRAGLAGSVRSIFRPEVRTVEAVKGISFEVERGELLALIGPNGAGKSTTIKMLTGILYPTGGHAEVLGMVPWKDRRKLAYQISSVFGQKPQLWYHLPAIDTFNLFAKIYELEPAAFRQRRDYLSEMFELGDLLAIPVRKLSLGQRMRCEIAASLLHRPRLILLDEPTIGLDVVAKQNIREIIRRFNQDEGATVLLTSHDAGDIESLCKRVIIINHGEIIYNDRVSALKRGYLTRKIIDVRFAHPPPADLNLDGVTLLKVGRFGAKLELDTRHTSVERAIQALMAARPVVDINVADPPLEEIIREIYVAEARRHRAGAGRRENNPDAEIEE
jgi:ABC-2 type transport system ATP-binding protein